jgi:nitrite reductase/ring-hydroxylating ferredoxin subunit
VIRLCALGDVPNPGCLEVSWGDGRWPLALFLVRRGDCVYGYLNRCPHAGHELNLRANEFLTRDGELILCRSHGAQFRIEDGYCVTGPCPGGMLESFDPVIREDQVFTTAEALARLRRSVHR